MPVPDRIELVRVYPVSRERVWAAITEPEQLAKWFVSAVQMEELRVGAPIRFMFEQFGNPLGIIEVVEPLHRFAFRWPAVPVGADLSVPVTQTYNLLVEFTLEDAPEGTRLTFVHSGFARLPADKVEGYQDRDARGWPIVLTTLETYLQDQAEAQMPTQ
jgi:uncharacterized protein YndB with AHSA1/START domain